MTTRNIFVVGLDDFQRERLDRIHSARDYRFHSLIEFDRIVHADELPLDDLLDRARRQLDEFDGSVDALIAHWDFPTIAIVPILCAERGLRAPSLRGVLQCAHKYWSRLRQRESIPELTPGFCAFDPREDVRIDDLELEPPFWIKPVEGYGSQLGFKIANDRDLAEALERLRAEIGRLGDPFNELLARVDVPDEIREIGGTHCIAEEYLEGLELAHEGHVFEGAVRIHGTLDMVRQNETFLGYEHPSELPREVLDRAQLGSMAFIDHVGFDNGVFNAEYFWNPDTDRLTMVEVNPRMSQSHSYLWDMVDGCSDHEIAIDIALGRPPRVHPRAGDYAKAAKMFVRTFEPGRVSRVPSEEDIARVKREFSGVEVQVHIEPGQDLRELVDQDAYSFALASLFIPADSHDQLLERYERIREMLPFSIEEAP